MAIRTYGVPDGEKQSGDLRVYAGGIPLPVHEAYVSAVPYNRRWPGHQRSKDQRELAYFVRFEADEPIEIRIIPRKSFLKAVVRPLSKKIVPAVQNGEIRFMLSSPGGYTVEIDGTHHALHLFVDPPRDYAPLCSGSNTIRFGPGIHRPGDLVLKSGQTLCIDEGAVVYASIRADNAAHIRILGRGILDNSEHQEEILFEVEQTGDGNTDVGNSRRLPTIHFTNCSDIQIDGITIRDSLAYNISAWGCDDFHVHNVKIIGCWRYNSDGIDLHNCRRCTVRGCFVRTYDDSICVKGHDGFQDICNDILVENCVVWCDWDHSLEIGAETRAENMQNITFRNCDVIHSTHVVLDVCNVDYGHVHDVLFEDIRVEYDDITPRPLLQPDDETPYVYDPDEGYMPDLIALVIHKHHEYSAAGDPRRGRISDISFRNIRIFSQSMPPSWLCGYDGEHAVEKIRIDGLYLNGEKITNINDARLQFASFVRDVELV